jgi:hypothetical protein
MAFYYHNEFEHFDFAYPDNYLLKMAHHGFNGIWCRVLLKELVRTAVFPEFGGRSEFLLSKLNAFIKRAARFGIRVYLFFTEPIGFREDDPFFKKYPELKGSPSYAGTCAICTSEQKVKDYLYSGFRNLIEQTHGLGGVILITASEHQTHCYSHVSVFDGDIVKCPKCACNTPAEIVSEIISLINSGIKSVSNDVKVIAWNWSWSYFEEDPQENIVGMLPADVILMADFERGGKRVADGMEHYVDEYSLSYIGPSERFQGAVNAAKERGMKFYAKLQIGVTHEIATVPYFPVPFKLIEKFTEAGRCGVSGAMECWNFGNILSLNTEIANWFSWSPQPVNADDFMRKIAIREYGEPSSDLFVQAWRIFSRATDYYPFSNQYIYEGPMHHGGAQPLFFKKINKPLAMTWLLPNEIKYNAYEEFMSRGEYGDDISAICKKFGVAGTLRLLNKMCDEWETGVKNLKTAVALASGEYVKNALKAFSVAAAVLSQFRSAAHFIEFTSLRNEFYDCLDLENKIAILEKMEAIAHKEKENSEELMRLLPMEKTLGFHGEAFGYMYNKKKIDRKLKDLSLMMESELLPAKQCLQSDFAAKLKVGERKYLTGFAGTLNGTPNSSSALF